MENISFYCALLPFIQCRGRHSSRMEQKRPLNGLFVVLPPSLLHAAPPATRRTPPTKWPPSKSSRNVSPEAARSDFINASTFSFIVSLSPMSYFWRSFTFFRPQKIGFNCFPMVGYCWWLARKLGVISGCDRCFAVLGN